MTDNSKRRIVAAIDALTNQGKSPSGIRMRRATADKHAINCTHLSFNDPVVVGVENVRPVTLAVEFDEDVDEDKFLVEAAVEQTHEQEA